MQRRAVLGTLVMSVGMFPGCKAKRERPQDRTRPLPKTPTGRWASAELIAGAGQRGAAKATGWTASMEGHAAIQAALSQPYIAVGDIQGRVFIADKKGHAIRMVDLEGNIHTVAGTGQAGNGSDDPQAGPSCALDRPNALWIGPSQKLYVLDLGNSKLRVLDSAGNIQTVLVLPEPLQGGRGLVLSQDESEIFISAKTKIWHFDAGIGLEVYAVGFENLAHLALDSNHELYAADKGAHRVFRIRGPQQSQVVAGNGTLIAHENPGPALERGLAAPRALVALGQGEFLVGTQDGGRVYHLDVHQQMRVLLSAKPTRAPNEERPLHVGARAPLPKLRGLSLTPQGHLLLTHADQGQVLRFRANPPPQQP